jgi:multiple sugar transport system permease protein
MNKGELFMNSKMKTQARLKTISIHTVLIVGAFIMTMPFIWMTLTSLKSLGEALRIPPTIIPENLKLSNYVDVFTSLPFGTFFINTIIVTVVIVLGQILFCSMAGYAFARIVFPGRNILFVLFLSILMIPQQAFLIPQYLLVENLGLLNSLTALILPGLFSAFGTFLMRQFFMTLPKELEESARIDGCNHFQIFWRIMLPLAKPGLLALTIVTVLSSWKSLMWPIIVNTSVDKMPLSAGLAYLEGQYVTDYPLLMTGALLALWPIIIIFVLLQRHFIEGISFTGSK